MQEIKLTLAQLMVVRDMERRGWSLYSPFFLSRGGHVSAFLWDKQSVRRDVSPRTLKALIKKGIVNPLPRHAEPIIRYELNVLNALNIKE